MTGTARATAIFHRCARIALVFAFVLGTAGPSLLRPHSAAAATATTTTALKLRAKPNTASAVKLVMPAGATVNVFRRLSNGFYRIGYQGVGGYAHGNYLSFGGGGGNSGGNNGGSSSGGATGNARTTSNLNLRAGPSTSDRVVAVMPSGASVNLTGDTSNGFLKVTYQGTTGWAHGSYISTSSGGGNNGGNSGGSAGSADQDPGSGNAGTARTTSSLNLRSGPTTSSRVLLVMPAGAKVTLTGNTSGGFAGVNYNGTRGWASQTYLTTGGGGNNGGGASGNYDTNGDGVWQRDEIIAIIYAAADYYGQPRADMLRVAICESNLDPYNVTPPYSASGLFQFLPGTWASTPYADQDIFSPVSSAFAAGWMWSVGRRNEWVCQ